MPSDLPISIPDAGKILAGGNFNDEIDDWSNADLNRIVAASITTWWSARQHPQ